MRDIYGLFFDKYYRAKKTPLHLSAIERKLEGRYHPWQVKQSLKKWKNLGILSSYVTKTKFIKKVVFYYPDIFEHNVKEKDVILKKISNSCRWIDKYSDHKITSIIGKHLHSLVKLELRAQGFKIIDEGRVNFYNGRPSRTRHSLDIIAEHTEKNIKVGIEVKNRLELISRKEIMTKIEMCQDFGIRPIFACRWLKPRIRDIEHNGGFAWEFKTQIYPFGMEDLVKKIRQRFGFKMKVLSELPAHSISKFEAYLNSIS